MSLMNLIRSGKEPLPPRLTVYGWEGVGKSTLGNHAPNAVFIDAEGGLGELSCHRFPRVKSKTEIFDALRQLKTADHPFHSVILDTADAIERILQAEVCKRYGNVSIEKAAGGYGKAYREVADMFEEMLALLDDLRTERRMVVMILAHAKVEKFVDPLEGEYDRYSPRLHKTTAALLKEWSDAVLFATRRMRIEREGDRASAKPIGHGAGDRILKTEGGPACVAKNRYGMPPEIPLTWDAIYAAISAAQTAAPANAAPPATATPPESPGPAATGTVPDA